MKRNIGKLQDELDAEFDDRYIADKIRQLQEYLNIYYPQETIIDFN